MEMLRPLSNNRFRERRLAVSGKVNRQLWAEIDLASNLISLPLPKRRGDCGDGSEQNERIVF